MARIGRWFEKPALLQAALGPVGVQWDPGIAPVQDLIRRAALVDHHRLADPAAPLTETLAMRDATGHGSQAA